MFIRPAFVLRLTISAEASWGTLILSEILIGEDETSGKIQKRWFALPLSIRY